MSKCAYKYKAWDKYARRIITHQELYFASPKDFNDVFDCQAHGIMSNNQFAENPFIIIDGKIIPYPNPSALLDKATKRGIDTCGVCCFSRAYNSILMWSHYADYNRGICFRFDLDKIKINGLFANVTYVRNKPIYDYTDPNEDKSKWFFYKYSAWKYEREIRGVVFSLENVKREQYRKVKFPKEALKEIIFGTNYTDKSTYDEVIDLCHDYGFHNVKFSFMEATTSSESYKLIKNPLFVKHQ